MQTIQDKIAELLAERRKVKTFASFALHYGRIDDAIKHTAWCHKLDVDIALLRIEAFNASVREHSLRIINANNERNGLKGYNQVVEDLAAADPARD